jgi:hypothetical protein
LHDDHHPLVAGDNRGAVALLGMLWAIWGDGYKLLSGLALDGRRLDAARLAMSVAGALMVLYAAYVDTSGLTPSVAEEFKTLDFRCPEEGHRGVDDVAYRSSRVRAATPAVAPRSRSDRLLGPIKKKYGRKILWATGPIQPQQVPASFMTWETGGEGDDKWRGIDAQRTPSSSWDAGGSVTPRPITYEQQQNKSPSG